MKMKCLVLSLLILVPCARANDPMGHSIPLACALTTAISGMMLMVGGSLGIGVSLSLGDKAQPCFGKPNQCCELVHVYPFTPTNCTQRASGKSCNDKTLFCEEESGLVAAPKSRPYSSGTVAAMSFSAGAVGAGIILVASGMLMGKVCILDLLR